MSGLLSLLDDVAAIAKVAAASVDDIAAASLKAGSKAVGVVIDDTAVTPRYVHGFSADRELPVIWRIAKGSLFNKLVILLPVALVLENLAPWAIAPLLLVGGAYLCFEGAEKVWHWLFAHGAAHADESGTDDPAHLEEQKAKGAIKTDFILSAEIMTIALAAIPESGIVTEAVTLAIVGITITALVYGAVAVIVKMDDVGLHMANEARTRAGRATGRGLVKGMPGLLSVLSLVGTAAMLWVGGSIVIHEADLLGWGLVAHHVHDWAAAAAHAVPAAFEGFTEWLVGAAAGLVAGLALGLFLMPVAQWVIAPVISLFGGRKTAH